MLTVETEKYKELQEKFYDVIKAVSYRFSVGRYILKIETERAREI
jgi:hypothetical protein